MYIQEQNRILQLGLQRYIVPPNYFSDALKFLRAMTNEVGLAMRSVDPDVRRPLLANVQEPFEAPPPPAPQVAPAFLDQPSSLAPQLTQFVPPGPQPLHFSLFPPSQAFQVQTARMFGAGSADHTQG